MNAQAGAQAGAQAPPPAPPTVIVINRDRRETPPYMKRGTEMYGIVMKSTSIAASLFLGVLLFFFSTMLIKPLMNSETKIGQILAMVAMWAAGGFLLHLHITARRKAKREFDALPFDHPDRVKYGGILLPGSVAASYPTANVAGPLAAAASSAPPSPGQQGSSAKGSDPPGGYPHQGPYPPPQGQYPHKGPYAPTQGQYPPPQGQYAASAPPNNSMKYDEDPPPYSEI
ncbi:trithorax group protein osa-like [Penaeus japonicus]|uniref:trithorax group protein osa-like n=1 Tax=Penaeus japonicus TaxID=27405 RepID=UPI001C70CED1|nr:trithorax group protein osa-like [Penaeus japonicus]XP_042855464.1 trithorax group protein osa-like [Penaeus japonicus]XP_042855465.1 trithorax group protein osa-like [Penaeus japonicus]XP_042855466.1 trithorax group protein osa-like [Penaeus japonicus]XP_042855467.1 trithorax group protein osa-like [Penaeus japonicus]XP_042855468.1 trithorax group protein osa-like [Penaeus japonicus]